MTKNLMASDAERIARKEVKFYIDLEKKEFSSKIKELQKNYEVHDVISSDKTYYYIYAYDTIIGGGHAKRIAREEFEKLKGIWLADSIDLTRECNEEYEKDKQVINELTITLKEVSIKFDDMLQEYVMKVEDLESETWDIDIDGLVE